METMTCYELMSLREVVVRQNTPSVRIGYLRRCQILLKLVYPVSF